MDDHLLDLIGYVAAVLTTTAFVPQVLKSWQTKDLSGVSLLTYSLFTLGVALWLVYGVILGRWPIIIANTITLTLSAIILALKLKYQ